MSISRILGVLFISALLMISCKTQETLKVRHVRNLETGHTLQGYYYALPRTVVTIDVAVVKTTEIPGPFAQYASRFLGLEEVITQTATRYDIADVNISSYAEPDPTEFYFVEYNPEKNKKNPLSIYLSESGLIYSVNAPFENDNTRALAPENRIQGRFGSDATFNHFIETNLQERIDTIIERVRMDTTTVERRTLRRTWVEKSSEVRAREVADFILKIRNKKFDVISGFAEIPYSRDAIQYMHEQLIKQESDYLELFTGIEAQSVIRYRYYYLPDKNQTGPPETLFYFSKSEGIVKEGRRGAEPVYIEIAKNQTTRQPEVFLMNPSRDKAVDRGFFFRIPEHGNISIHMGNRPIADSRLLISQFGIITSLPADNLRIEFYPETGSVKSLERIVP